MREDVQDAGMEIAPGTFALAILTMIAVVAACFLATYVIADKVPGNLGKAGFSLWSGPSIFPALSDFMSSNDNRAWPIEAIWVDFVPGQTLAFAFTNAALVWASFAGAASLAAGLLALTAAIRWQVLNWQVKQAFGALTFLSAGICIAVMAFAGGDQPPHGFTIDLQNGMSDGVLGMGTTSIPTVPLMKVTTRIDQHICPSIFGNRHYYYPNRCFETVSFITNGYGQSVNLMSLSNYQDVYAINDLVLKFLNSQGREE